MTDKRPVNRAAACARLAGSPPGRSTQTTPAPSPAGSLFTTRGHDSAGGHRTETYKVFSVARPESRCLYRLGPPPLFLRPAAPPTPWVRALSRANTDGGRDAGGEVRRPVECSRLQSPKGPVTDSRVPLCRQCTAPWTAVLVLHATGLDGETLCQLPLSSNGDTATVGVQVCWCKRQKCIWTRRRGAGS